MTIVRLSKTFPRVDHQGIGLHCFNYSIYSKSKNIIFTSKMNSDYIKFDENQIQIFEIINEFSSGRFLFKKEKISPVKFLFYLFIKLLYEIYFCVNTIFILKKNKITPKIIHVHSINHLVTGYFLKLIFRVPIFLNIGGSEIVRLKKNKLTKFILCYINCIFYVSKEMKKHLMYFFNKKKLVHINNGIDIENFDFNTMDKRKKQIVSIGNLRWQKGHQYLIKAFKNFLDNGYDDYILYIVGDGPLLAEITNLINNLNLSNNIKIIKKMDRYSISKILRESEIFILSSVSEGFPKVLIESIASGTPIIATDVGDCRRVVGKNGLIVKPRSSKALADAILTLINKNSLKRKMNANAFNDRDKYSWKKVATIINRCYTKF